MQLPFVRRRYYCFYVNNFIAFSHIILTLSSFISPALYRRHKLSLLIDYGFKALNLHNIFLSVVSFNERAIRSYEKIGFKIIGRKREAILRCKERHDMIYMDILHNEFYEKMDGK